MVDATDRLRVDDCRDELAGLLVEEVETPLKISPNSSATDHRAEVDRRKLTCLLEQDRCQRLYDHRRSEQGESPAPPFALSWLIEATGTSAERNTEPQLDSIAMQRNDG